MLKFADYDIVFQEVPDETTLALNLSNCPHRCEGCHSPQLREDIGEELTESALDLLLMRYPCVTCVALMGGDADHEAVYAIARYIHTKGKKVAWYTGDTALPDDFPMAEFDFVKVGPYIEALGGLKSPNTNQRFYHILNNRLIDETYRFWNQSR